MGCEYTEMIACQDCGWLDRADRIIYSSHECDPERRAEFLAGQLHESLDSGELMSELQGWLASSPQAKRFFDYAVARRTRFA